MRSQRTFVFDGLWGASNGVLSLPLEFFTPRGSDLSESALSVFISGKVFGFPITRDDARSRRFLWPSACILQPDPHPYPPMYTHFHPRSPNPPKNQQRVATDPQVPRTKYPEPSTKNQVPRTNPS